MLGNISVKTVSDMSTLIELIKNADEYHNAVSELQDKINTLKAEREKLTKAKKLDSLIAEYKEKNEISAKAISEAKQKAIDIIGQANSEATSIKIQSESDVQKIYEQARLVSKESQETEAKAEALKNQAQTMLAEAQELMKQAINKAAKNKEESKALAEKREALEKALNM